MPTRINKADERRELEFRRQLKSMVVRIYGSLPCAENDDGKKYFEASGTIVVANNMSCYVVVKRSIISDDASYHIVLPDGSEMDISSSDFSTPKQAGHLSGFHIKHSQLEYDLYQLAAVKFGGDVSMFEHVHLCDFRRGNCIVTDGLVNAVDAGIAFTHTCGATPTTANGAPVFNEDGHLVGICLENNQGPTIALNRANLEKELNKIFESQDLEHFQNLAEIDGLR